MVTDKKTVFRGVATALVTPFCDGGIDFPALTNLIELQIEAGVCALVIGGTTGEVATLDDTERYALYKFARERIGGRTKLILGTGTNDTRAAVRHTQIAETIGCDAVLLVTPYYNKGTEEGVYQHYLTVAESTNLPIILYNVPSRTGVNLGFNLLYRLSEIPNIVGLKEASDSLDRLVELSRMNDRLTLYAGNDSQIYSVLSLFGEGVISVISNLYPKETVEIYSAYLRGDTRKGLALQQAFLPFIGAIFAETNPSPIKYAMSLVGLIRDEVRLPLSTPRESTRERIVEEMHTLSKIGIG